MRSDVRFSDGTPFTAEDVLFSFDAVYDDTLASPLSDSLRINGKRLELTAKDETTGVVTFPELFSPGIRLLHGLPMLPKHKLASAMADGTLADALDVTTPLESLVGLGPFVLSDYRPGQRLILGFSHPVVSWGVMLQEASNVRAIADFPWLLSPALGIIGVVLGVNLTLRTSSGHEPLSWLAGQTDNGSV